MTSAYELHMPATAREAIDLLARHGEDAHLMAGGTSLVLMMQQGLIRPTHVVSLHKVEELRGIRRAPDGSLEIGALTTHREIERSPLVRAHCAMLTEAFARIATVRIRGQATLGGNLAHADPAQDPPPALIAVGAMVLIQGQGSAREIPIEDLSVDIFTTSLAPGELIVGVRIPPLTAGTRAAYLKFLPRTEDDYATVSVAVAAVVAADGTVRHLRIALGAVGSTPIRARAAEAALLGLKADELRIKAAAVRAAEATDPIDDGRGSAGYKRSMARVFTERALRAVIA